MSSEKVRLNSAEEAIVKKILAEDGHMSRRTAIGWLGAMGISAAAAGTLVTSAGRVLAATPQRGGRLRVAGHSTSASDTLDPARLALSTDYARAHMFYNGLTRIDGNAEAQPELAESFEPGKDASEWIFTLRNGLTFHNGRSVTTDDVIFSIVRHKDEAVGSGAKALADQISEVVADGPNKVIVRLNAPNGDLPVMLGTFHFMIIPEGTTEFSTAIGTGPYAVGEFTPGVRSIALRNENYFKEGRPYVDEIEFFGIADDIARINALYSGDVHLITSIKPTAAKEIEAREGVDVFRTGAPRFSQLVMDNAIAPMDNKHLRLAIKYLIDRERLLTTVAQGYGQLGNDHPIAPSSPLYNSEIEQHMLDHDKAKFHLKEAGMEGATLELHVSEAAANSIETGQFLQREAAQIGLNIDLKREPRDGYWSNIWLKRGFYGGEWNPRPTYDMILSLAWTSTAKWNETKVQHPSLDNLIAEGRVTVDGTKRKEIYGEVQKIISEDGGNAIPMFIDYLDARSSKVRGLSPVPTGGLGGYNFADTVWLES